VTKYLLFGNGSLKIRQKSKRGFYTVPKFGCCRKGSPKHKGASFSEDLREKKKKKTRGVKRNRKGGVMPCEKKRLKTGESEAVLSGDEERGIPGGASVK